jgi:hypothetical protein
MNRTICWICFPTSASFILDDDHLVRSTRYDVLGFLGHDLLLPLIRQKLSPVTVGVVCCCFPIRPWMDESQRREGRGSARRPTQSSDPMHACEKSGDIRCEEGGTGPLTKFGLPFLSGLSCHAASRSFF